MTADLTERQRVALRAGSHLARRRTSAARSCRTSCSSTARTTARRTRARTAPTSTASCRSTSARANEGFGKVTFTPASSVLLNFSYRDSEREDTSDALRRERVGDDRHGQRSQAEDRHRRRLVGHQLAQPADLQVHPLRRSRRMGTPDYIANVDISTALGTRLDIATPRFAGPPDGADPRSPARRRTTRSSSRSSIATATSRTASASAAARSATARSSTTTTSSATPARSATTSRSAARSPRPARRLSAVRRCRGPDPQLERLGPDHGPWRAHELQPARRSSTPRASSSRRPVRRRPSTRSTTRRASRSTTRSAGRTGRSTSACSPATTRSTARACAKTTRRSPATSLAPGNKYKMYDIPFSKMIQPRLGATWAYNGTRHRLRQLRPLQPGGELAAARGVVGPQPHRHVHRRPLRRQRRAVRRRARRLLVRQAVRRRPDAAHDRRVPGRHARGSSTAA